ncbi:hypothetical protein T07_13431 [Trichinella nelsoni]|uniref:Uncharacterized protein n=1 Tax=Trichinella nelsoni TaxID=6336 RepID=A0A0V0SHQ3_9BILA|nr:hypothetical protein T07_13431 [Trichinella nelsoni]
MKNRKRINEFHSGIIIYDNPAQPFAVCKMQTVKKKAISSFNSSDSTSFKPIKLLLYLKDLNCVINANSCDEIIDGWHQQVLNCTIKKINVTKDLDNSSVSPLLSKYRLIISFNDESFLELLGKWSVTK